MHTEVRFGISNKPKKIQQSLYVRIKHNNLDWNRSLKIKIDSEDWNFKKQEIITHRSTHKPIHSEHIKEISQTVYDLAKYLQYQSEKHYHTNYFEVKQWVKNKERKRFIDLCDKWYSDYYNQNKVDIQPYFIEAYREAKNSLGQTNHQDKTETRWGTIEENIQAFMDDKRNIRTDEFSNKVWIEMVEYFRKEYKHRDKTGNIGLSDYTILTILKKIRAVKNHLAQKYIFHYDMNHLKFKALKKKFDTLTEDELSRFFGSSGEAKRIQSDKIKKWFYQIQYYGCFRISEVYKNLYRNPEDKFPKLKTPREIWENEIYLEKNANGDTIRVWKCKQVKDEEGVGSKNLPLHSKLAEALFGTEFPQDIFPERMEAFGVPVTKLYVPPTQIRFMKETLKKLGINKDIKSHEIRKSFITNERKKGVQKGDIMQYSGHDSEEAYNLYVNEKDNFIPTQVNLG